MYSLVRRCANLFSRKPRGRNWFGEMSQRAV